MNRRLIISIIVCPLLFSGSSIIAKTGTLPAHPSAIHYAPLDWKVPSGTSCRTVLSNGLVAYIAEDHTLLLLNFPGM